MKKSKLIRKISMAIFLMVFTVSISCYSFAEPAAKEDSVSLATPAVVTQNDMNYSEADLERFEKEAIVVDDEDGLSTSSIGTQALPLTRTEKKIISTKNYSDKFIGYNSKTPNWSYASKYVLKKSWSCKFSTSWEYNGVTCALETSYSSGVDIHIPANAKKKSRLAAKADVKAQKIQYKRYVDGSLVSTWYKGTAKKTGALTNYVKYK